MRSFSRLRRDRPYYLIPIMLGMAGVLFSNQFDDMVIRTIVVGVCVTVPMFIGGNLLGRIYSDGLQRWLLIAGMAGLSIGAVLTVSGLTEGLVDSEFVPQAVGRLSRRIGIGSLLLGLLGVLYGMVRSEALFDELGDRFRHVADHMGEGFILSDAAGTAVLINRALTEMTGIQEKDIVGQRLQELATRYGVEPVVQHGARRKRGVASTYEVVWTRESGEMWFLVSESPLRDRRGRRIGTLLTLHDSTEEHRLRVRLEEYTQGLQELVETRTEKLRASERRYRELVMTMNEGFVTIDENLRVRFTNERIRDILRLSGEMIEGRHLTDFIHPTDRRRMEEALTSSHGDRPAEANQEYVFVREDGGGVPVKVSVAQLDGPVGGQGARYSLVITDVQEIKAMQQELEHRAAELEVANRELRELDKAKNVFLSNVSHELRTPLGTVDGYIDMIASESLGAVAAPQKAALEVMSRNIERLTSMINEMIESSRMEIRGIRLVRELWGMRPLVAEALASAQPEAVRKDLSVSLHAAETLPFQWGDRDKLAQVLGILLSNAMKFTPAGGGVSLVAEVKGRDVVYAVSDTGIGIAPEHHERVFKKFYQVDSSMTRHYQGSGIGLSIAKAIVEAHGGRIDLESAPGQGSTFRVVMPQAAFMLSEQTTDTAPLAGRRVFLVNDFPESVEALAWALEGAGAEVVRFRSGFECIRQARENRPHAIILDEALHDPEVSGAVQLMLDCAETKTVPLITLWDRKGDHPSEAEEAVSQASRVLIKPFTAGTLVRTVDEELSRADAFGERPAEAVSARAQ